MYCLSPRVTYHTACDFWNGILLGGGMLGKGRLIKRIWPWPYGKSVFWTQGWLSQARKDLHNFHKEWMAHSSIIINTSLFKSQKSNLFLSTLYTRNKDTECKLNCNYPFDSFSNILVFLYTLIKIVSELKQI